MNWAAVAAVGSLLSIFAVVIAASFTHGKLTQRVDAADDRLDKHEERFDKHEDKFDHHDAKIGKLEVTAGKLEQWKDGFNAAARVSGNKEVQ